MIKRELACSLVFLKILIERNKGDITLLYNVGQVTKLTSFLSYDTLFLRYIGQSVNWIAYRLIDIQNIKTAYLNNLNYSTAV